MNIKLWLKWSYRDAKQRWLQVLAISLILALGIGVFSGFGKQREWRIKSLDKSFEMLAMFDLHMELTEGSFIEQAALEEALSNIEGVETVEARLLIPTLIDASKQDESILYPGRLIGQDTRDGGPHISKLNLTEGEGYTDTDAGSNKVVIDHLFTTYRNLSPGNPVKIAGNIELDFIGRGQSPENLMIIPGTGGFMENENTFATMYMPLESVQKISGHEGMVNDVVFLLNDDANPDEVISEIEKVISANFADTGFNFTKKADDPVYSAIYTDARGDQRFWNIIGGLFLFGAAMATFNLASRIVEAQRREIGVGMALGVKRHLLAFRPILLGVQIAILGTLLGLLVGYGFTQALVGIFDSYLPLPYWSNPFYIEGYLRAIGLGILVPVIATLFPVWRAIRVHPIDAIQTGYLVAKGGGLSYLMKYLPIPGKSFMQMPFRNVLRSPWRTLMTVLGVSIAIMLLVAMAGMLDTFQRTIDQGSDFYTQKQSSRVTVMTDNFYPINGEYVNGIASQDEQYSHVDIGLMMIGEYVNGNNEEMPVVIEMFNSETALWQPTVKEGKLPDSERGIVISEKAADDLDVKLGDIVQLSHPVRDGLFSYRMKVTDIPIIGIHDNPMRMQAYMSLNQADMMGMQGLTNTLTLYPAEEVTIEDVRRAMFNQPGIASVMVVEDIAKSFEEAIELFNAVMLMIQGIVVVLAFLIAFNSTSISVDERVREIATMFAFGLPVRTVTRMHVVENLIIGFFGTLLGIFFGYLIIIWMVEGQIEEMIPDIKFLITISQNTIITAAILGIAVVGLTPLLSIRKMLHMDIPSTLRVME